MKRKFKRGEPSIFDICNENFNNKSLAPKVSRLNNLSLTKKRHHSVTFPSPTNK